MNAQLTEQTEKTGVVVSKTTTALAVVTAAIAEINSFEAGIAELEAKFGKLVFDVKTPKGMKEARAALSEVRKPRYALQKLEQAAKAPLNGLKDSIKTQTEAMVKRVSTIEDPIAEAVTNEEDRLHNEAVARAAAETKRVEDLEARLDSISTMPYESLGLASADVAKILKEAKETVIGDDWQEFAEKAKVALVATVAALEGVLAKALADEAEKVRIAAERVELERLRAENAERERAAKVIADQEAAKVAAEQKAEGERLYLLAREQERIEGERLREHLKREREAQDRLDADRKALEVQQAEIAKAQRELAEQQEAARIAALPKVEPEPEIVLTPDPVAVIDTVDVGNLPAPDRHQIFSNGFTSHFAHESAAAARERREISIPSDEAIIKCVADHFRVSLAVAIEYIVSVAMNHEEAA